MGRFGQINSLFGSRQNMIWVEVQWPAWIVDGGVVLLVLYSCAIVLAMFDSARVALKCPDKQVAFWAAVVASLNLSVLANCFRAMPFLASPGMQFWTLAAVVNFADRQARAELKGMQARPAHQTLDQRPAKPNANHRFSYNW